MSESLDPEKLPHGLYLLHWRGGGTSMAAVGSDAKGRRWYMPTNWVSGPCLEWGRVARVEAYVSREEHEPAPMAVAGGSPLTPEQRTAALLAVHFGDNWAENVPGTFQVALRSLCVEVERLQFELKAMTESRRLACVGWDAAIEERERLQIEVERLRAMNERAAALVEAHETGDGSNLCEMLAAKIRALLPSQ